MKTPGLIACLLVLQPVWAQDGESEPGKQLYYDFGCYGCHGFNATMRVPLVGDASGIMSSEALFLNYLRLRADQNPVNPRNAMPNYSADTLSDAQARIIYAYIRSVEDDVPPIDEIPAFVELLEDAKQTDEN